MKNKLLIITTATLFMITLMSINLTRADTTTTPCQLSMDLVNQDPNPAVPGDYVKVLIQVSGIENPYCNGAKVKLEPEYPFSLDPGDTTLQTLAASTYVQDYKTAWTIPYKLRIASDAIEGDYQLKLICDSGVNNYFDDLSVEKHFNITVTDVQTDFDAVIQETSGTQVSIGIVNTGKNTANSLVVGIPQQDNFVATGTSKQIVGNLAAGDYTLVSFDIASRLQRNGNRTIQGQNSDNQVQNIGSGNEQMLEVQIDYTDGIGKRRSTIKDIQFSSTATQGNFTAARLTSGQTGRSSTSSGTSVWWYVAGAVVLVAVGVVVYKRKEIKYFYKKTRHEKSSGNPPDWVSAERTPRKK